MWGWHWWLINEALTGAAQDTFTQKYAATRQVAVNVVTETDTRV